jgi:hypothetical protein
MIVIGSKWNGNKGDYFNVSTLLSETGILSYIFELKLSQQGF